MSYFKFLTIAFCSFLLNLPTTQAATVAGSPVLDLEIRYLPVGAMLTWASTEGELEGFNIERSTDGFNFEVLSRVSADKLDDETYNYLDTDRPAERHYYRITAFDAVGTTSYSDLAEAAPSHKASWYLAGNYSVDVTERFDFEVEAQGVSMLACELYDFLGAQVAQAELLVTPGPNQLSMPTLKLAPGTYRLEVKGEDISESVHFVKMAQDVEPFQPMVRGN